MIDDIYHENVRYLGHLLGEVIKEQEGEKTFNLIENVRRLSVSYRRHDDVDAAKALDKMLKNLMKDKHSLLLVVLLVIFIVVDVKIPEAASNIVDTTVGKAVVVLASLSLFGVNVLAEANPSYTDTIISLSAVGVFLPSQSPPSFS